MLVSFFESDETESNGPSFKMQIFLTFFTFFPIKMVKWVKKFCQLKLVSFFESDKTESNGPSVKMQNFGSFYSCDFWKRVEMGRNGSKNVVISNYSHCLNLKKLNRMDLVSKCNKFGIFSTLELSQQNGPKWV